MTSTASKTKVLVDGHKSAPQIAIETGAICGISTQKILASKLAYLHSAVSVILIGGILVLGMLDITRWLPYFSYVVRTFLLAP